MVIGGAGGIGLATARTLVASGCRVVLVDREASALDELATGLSDPGGDVAHRALDATDSAAVDALARDLASEGPVAGLVNSAGIVQLGTVLDVTDEDWDRMLAVNLKAVFYGCRAFVPVLRDAGGGAIVNIGSVSGRTKSIFSAPNYVAAKAGVIGLTMVVAAQHAADGVRVNCVAPGIVDTPMLDAYSDDQRTTMRAAIPMGRYAEAREIGETVAYLLSDQASYLTGQTLNVNGGQFMM